MELTNYQLGYLLGILVGEGHFGNDGVQPQVVLKMDIRHGPMLEQIKEWVPKTKLYGPYFSQGREFYQLMWRGEGLSNLISLIDKTNLKELDPHVWSRYLLMKSYVLFPKRRWRANGVVADTRLTLKFLKNSAKLMNMNKK